MAWSAVTARKGAASEKPTRDQRRACDAGAARKLRDKEARKRHAQKQPLGIAKKGIANLHERGKQALHEQRLAPIALVT